MKLCVYTVLTGRYETLQEQPAAATSNADFICFTDSVEQEPAGWNLRYFDVPFPADPRRSSRMPKLLPHEFVPDYDVSLYIDNSVRLETTPEKIVSALLSDRHDMAALRHSFRETVRSEFDAVLDARLDDPDTVLEQLEHYETQPDSGLDLKTIWCGMIVRRHNEPVVRAAMRSWWFHVLRYSRRDQLSFRIASAQLGDRLHEVDLDNKASGFHTWPVAADRDAPSGFAGRPSRTELQTELAEALARTVANCAEIADLHSQVEVCGSELRATVARLTDQAATTAALQDRIRAMQQSRSWKIGRTFTAPVRRARRVRSPRRSGGGSVPPPQP